MPSAASEADAKRVDDAVRAKDEDALRDAVSKDDTRELGSLAVLRCAETGWIEGLRTAVDAGAHAAARALGWPSHPCLCLPHPEFEPPVWTAATCCANG